MGFIGRAVELREERICAIAAYYAQQIADAIPGAVVNMGIERQGMAGAGARHSVYLVKHPHGHIVVSAGYIAARDDTLFDMADDTLSDKVKVIVLSNNSGGNGVISVGHADPFVAPGG